MNMRWNSSSDINGRNTPGVNGEVKITVNISIENISEKRSRESALKYDILERQLKDAVGTVIKKWPNVGMFTVLSHKEWDLNHPAALYYKEIVYKNRNKLGISPLGEGDSSRNSKSQPKNFSCIEEAVSFIEENYYRDISLKDVSCHVFLSNSYFSHMFKKLVGCGVMEFITHVRVKQACKLLINTNYQVGEIAEQVGYMDSRHFSQVFRRIQGCTPTSFRRYAVAANRIKEKNSH
ncbi:MAG: AraC family transcriptional regulator [Dehalobacterium sp.]